MRKVCIVGWHFQSYSIYKCNQSNNDEPSTVRPSSERIQSLDCKLHLIANVHSIFSGLCDKNGMLRASLIGWFWLPKDFHGLNHHKLSKCLFEFKYTHNTHILLIWWWHCIWEVDIIEVTFSSLTLNAWHSTMRVFAAPIERLNAKYLMKIETVIKTQYYFWTPNQKIRSAAAKNASGSRL